MTKKCIVVQNVADFTASFPVTQDYHELLKHLAQWTNTSKTLQKHLKIIKMSSNFSLSNTGHTCSLL